MTVHTKRARMILSECRKSGTVYFHAIGKKSYYDCNICNSRFATSRIVLHLRRSHRIGEESA